MVMHEVFSHIYNFLIFDFSLTSFITKYSSNKRFFILYYHHHYYYHYYYYYYYY